jgi:hypothetical protein
MADASLSIEKGSRTEAQPGLPLIDQHVFLIGRPPLKQWLDFVTNLAMGEGGKVDTQQLADEWRAAHAHIRELEKLEAGWADKPEIRPLPPHLEPLREQVSKDLLFHRAFRIVPADIWMVELDRLVVYQKHINLEHVRHLKDRLGPAPSDEEIFRLCLPFDHPQPPIRMMKSRSNTYVFVSPSNDLRLLGDTLFGSSSMTGQSRLGVISGIVGIVVGFSSNFLHAIRAEGRLVLNNGSHRAYALRDIGVTHAPCIVKHVSSQEELKAVAPSDVRKNPELYMQHPRPSVLKDYFDPRLRKLVDVPRKLHQIRVTFEAEETEIPAM